MSNRPGLSDRILSMKFMKNDMMINDEEKDDMGENW